MISQKVLHALNNFISWIVIGLALYILLFPFIPEVQYELVKTVQAAVPSVTTKNEQGNIPKDNRLVIPQIGVDAPILEGNDASVLDRGIWRRPNTSTPVMGGNTVLVGHRFMYTSGPTTFYLLPKLKLNDRFSVFWQGKKIEYVVKSTEVVLPTAVEVEASTDKPTLTLYTCTPVWNPVERFVIKAEPVI